MNRFLTLRLLLICAILFPSFAFGQNGYWQTVTRTTISGANTITPYILKSQTWELTDPAAFEALLLETSSAYETATTLELPLPDGSLRPFRVWEKSVMHPLLAAQFPNIHSYTAEAIGDATVTAKLDLNNKGFHAMIFDGEKTSFIAPEASEKSTSYLAFYKKEMAAIPGFSCGANELKNEQEITHQNAQRTNDTMLKTFRLALAATGEYTGFHGGTVADALAAQVVTMNRVNGIYERELSVTMEIIPNNNLIIYTNGLTDPYTNSNGNAMLTQNINNCSNVIGNANFDIGHVFSTGGGGVAFLGSVCGNSKAGGVTGGPAPVGDGFDVDFVAHEMGHQFGGSHTFNGTTSNCGGGNRSASSAYEPGSGTTIQAYAGICGAENLQNNSDAYFHTRSLDQMSSFITTGNGNTCAVATATGNVPATFPSMAATYNIPYKTPFELTASMPTDATADEAITYCWDEYDMGAAAPPNNDISAERPLLRSFFPTTNPTRVFPSLSKILANQLFMIGETLPQRTRDMTFVLTTRDFYQGTGAFNSTFDGASVTLSVQNTGGSTFDVTSQASGTTAWAEGENRTITWQVAGTNAAPVNAPNVDILLSIDGGNTFPFSLASNTPNDGSQVITVPNVTSAGNNISDAVVKVKGSGNVFFQLNKGTITIANNPLPVTLLSFSGQSKNCEVTLTWEIADARDFSHFLVERSADGRNWQTAARVNHEYSKTTYQFSEISPLKKKAFYRMQLVDLDGTTDFSNIILLSLQNCGGAAISISPNPATSFVQINNALQVVSLRLIAADGRMLKEKKCPPASEQHLDIRNFPAGVYVLEALLGNGGSQKVRLVKR